MSQENVELAKALYAQGSDLCRLLRDEDRFARLREVVGPLFTTESATS